MTPVLSLSCETDQLEGGSLQAEARLGANSAPSTSRVPCSRHATTSRSRPSGSTEAAAEDGLPRGVVALRRPDYLTSNRKAGVVYVHMFVLSFTSLHEWAIYDDASDGVHQSQMPSPSRHADVRGNCNSPHHTMKVLSNEEFFRAFLAALRLRGADFIDTRYDRHHARFAMTVIRLHEARARGAFAAATMPRALVPSPFTGRYREFDDALIKLQRGLLGAQNPYYPGIQLIVTPDRANAILARLPDDICQLIGELADAYLSASEDLEGNALSVG